MCVYFYPYGNPALYEPLNQIKLQKNLAKTTHFQGIFYRSINKQEYAYDPRTKTVRIIDGVTVDDVRNAVRHFYEFYRATYIPRFKNRPANFSMPEETDNLLLGGGAGFFSKTVIYNLYRYEDAKEYAAEWFEITFPKGKHEYVYPHCPAHFLLHTIPESSDALRHLRN